MITKLLWVRSLCSGFYLLAALTAQRFCNRGNWCCFWSFYNVLNGQWTKLLRWLRGAKGKSLLSSDGERLSQGCALTLPSALPPHLASFLIHVSVGGGARLAVKHLSLLTFGIFFLSISFFPPIDPISCHIASPAYPPLTQTLLQSFLHSIPLQFLPSSCLSGQIDPKLFHSSVEESGEDKRHELSCNNMWQD